MTTPKKHPVPKLEDEMAYDAEAHYREEALGEPLAGLACLYPAAAPSEPLRDIGGTDAPCDICGETGDVRKFTDGRTVEMMHARCESEVGEVLAAYQAEQIKTS